MSGKLAALRQRALAIRVADMKAAGHTARAIAEAVGKRPEQIKSLALLGERFKSESPAPRGEA